MLAKEIGPRHPHAECDLGECLAVKRMLSEGCPNVQPIAPRPKSSPRPPEKSAPMIVEERR